MNTRPILRPHNEIMPCGKDVENGITWHKALRQECFYIEHIKKERTGKEETTTNV